LAASGAAGWKAKLELAGDPLFEDLKDRAIAIARERAAEEAEGPAFMEAEVAELDTYGDLQPRLKTERAATAKLKKRKPRKPTRTVKKATKKAPANWRDPQAKKRKTPANLKSRSKQAR
jgi:hypothetical protein